MSNSGNNIPVDMIDLETGKVIRTFNSMKEASFKTGVRLSGISAVCLGVNKQCGGYGWRKNFDKAVKENMIEEKKNDWCKKSPIVEANNDILISIDYLIRGLRDIQNGRYATSEYEKEYICIENIISYINTTASFFLRGGL